MKSKIKLDEVKLLKFHHTHTTVITFLQKEKGVNSDVDLIYILVLRNISVLYSWSYSTERNIFELFSSYTKHWKFFFVKVHTWIKANSCKYTILRLRDGVYKYQCLQYVNESLL